MLAEQKGILQPAGRLSADLHLPSQWRHALVDFIANALPAWRDDPIRPAATAETVLTAQLCAMLNGTARRSSGWDYLQFRMEEPDEVKSGRAIDLVAAPAGVLVWIDGRRFSQYEPLLPIECKRLPTPTGRERDPREYLHSRHGSRGGVQRFKSGDHGAAHNHAALIAYLQTDDTQTWFARLTDWITELSGAHSDWSANDGLNIEAEDPALGIVRLSSVHERSSALAKIRLDHLWIRM